MNTGFGSLKQLIGKATASPRLSKSIIAASVIFVVLQLYFVQELIAAELLFAIAFVALFLLGLLFYTLGTIGERSFNLAEVGVRAFAVVARRGYAAMEEISRKPFRHPRSESAQ
ncbi:MAG: hypothetical protein ACRD8A_12110 [Candidatus Acidiferrales bacterium]